MNIIPRNDYALYYMIKCGYFLCYYIGSLGVHFSENRNFISGNVR